MKTLKTQLETYTELHWWNMGTKTLSHKGTLKDLLDASKISFTRRKTGGYGVFKYKLKSQYGITFETQGTIEDFPHIAKQFVQMELVRRGGRSQLYVQGCWRPKVTVNF